MAAILLRYSTTVPVGCNGGSAHNRCRFTNSICRRTNTSQKCVSQSHKPRPSSVLRFQQAACTLITRLFQYQQSVIPAQPHLLIASLQALLGHQLRQPLCSPLTGLPTAYHPSSNPLRHSGEGHAPKSVPSMKTSGTRLIICCCCCFCWCPLLRCF